LEDNHTVAFSGRKLPCFTFSVPAVSWEAFIFTKLREGLVYFSGNFAIHCCITKQVAWSRHYSDLHFGYVWFEVWLWYDCLEWGFSWISSVCPGKHARVIPWLLSVQCLNSLALELVI